jgi:hypothetical protein
MSILTYFSVAFAEILQGQNKRSATIYREPFGRTARRKGRAHGISTA